MPQKTKAELKAYFNTGDRPTEAQFGDLIDSTFNTVGFVAADPVLIDPAPVSGALYQINSDCSAGTRFFVHLSETSNMAEPTNPVNGEIYTWLFVQGASGSADVVFVRGFRIQDFGMVTGQDNISILQCVYSTELATMVEINAKQLS